jgi:hypothetical protein
MKVGDQEKGRQKKNPEGIKAGRKIMNKEKRNEWVRNLIYGTL